MPNFIAQIVVGSDGKLRRKKKEAAKSSRPSRTRRLIKLITAIKRFKPEFSARGFATQRVLMRQAKTSRQAWMDQMIKDLLLLKREVIASAKLAGIKPKRYTRPEKKDLRKDLMHFRAEILGKVAAPIAAGAVASGDSDLWKKARKAAKKQYPGLYKRNKARFKAVTESIYNSLQSHVAAPAPVASVGAPDLNLWNQSLAEATRELGDEHPKLWMYARHLYKKAGGGEVPGLNTRVGSHTMVGRLGGFDIDYSGLSEEAKRAKAVKDIKARLGNNFDKTLKNLLAATVPKEITAFKRFTFACSFAGIHGYPVRALWETYVGNAVEEKHLETLKNLVRKARVKTSDQAQWDADIIKDALEDIAQNLKEIPDYDRLEKMEQGPKKPTRITLAPTFREIDIEALAAAADTDERAVRANIGADVPWYPDEWQG